MKISGLGFVGNSVGLVGITRWGAVIYFGDDYEH